MDFLFRCTPAGFDVCGGIAIESSLKSSQVPGSYWKRETSIHLDRRQKCQHDLENFVEKVLLCLPSGLRVWSPFPTVATPRKFETCTRRCGVLLQIRPSKKNKTTPSQLLKLLAGGISLVLVAKGRQPAPSNIDEKKVSVGYKQT
jgi:hypothetical protein